MTTYCTLSHFHLLPLIRCLLLKSSDLSNNEVTPRPPPHFRNIEAKSADFIGVEAADSVPTGVARLPGPECPNAVAWSLFVGPLI